MRVVFGAAWPGNKKTHDRCQPWVLVEISSSATSPGGVDDDDNQIHSLQRPKIHAAGKVMGRMKEVKSGFLDQTWDQVRD
jgi:hypothetical protein